MKKFGMYLLSAFLLVAVIPSQLNAGAVPISSSTDSSRTSQSPEANVLIVRLNEIKLMDRSKLSSTEKKQLKNEVRIIKNQLKEMRGGIYLSVGSIIIIILLLILIL